MFIKHIFTEKNLKNNKQTKKQQKEKQNNGINAIQNAIQSNEGINRNLMIEYIDI